MLAGWLILITSVCANAARVSTVVGRPECRSSNSTCLSEPWGVDAFALDGVLSLYFAEFGGSRVQDSTRCDAAGYKCSTVDPNPACMSAPGRKWDKPINSCECGCDVFYQDASGHRVRTCRMTGGKCLLSTVAGSGQRGFKDGPAATAMFNHPYDVVSMEGKDSTVDLYIADAYNHRVRHYDGKNDVVRTVIGTGVRGAVDGPAVAASLNFPTGLARDPHAHLLYIADRGNNCIRVYSEHTGEVSTFAGNCSAGEWGHQDGSNALFNGPSQLALAPGGHLYVSDAGSGVVRSIDLVTAEVSTLAATRGTVLMKFPLGLAHITTPSGGGDLYVTSTQGGQIVRFADVRGSTASSVHVVAGTGLFAFADGVGEHASFRGPRGLAPAPDSSAVFVGDWYNNALRQIDQLNSPAGGLKSSSRRRNATTSGAVVPGDRSSRAFPRAREAGGGVRVLVWTGHSGPFHDHYANGKVLASGLNASGFVAVLADREEAFATATLQQFDVLLMLADTYENPKGGALTQSQWDSLFSFVAGGGGLFALHTASACWVNHNDTMSVKFHKELLNAEFGGHSPYKDYISTVMDPLDPITHGLADYVVTDELYFPTVYNRSRSTIFLTAYDTATNGTAVHGLRHTYGKGRVLYFAQGHDMAEYENVDLVEGNYAFQTIITRSLQWLTGNL